MSLEEMLSSTRVLLTLEIEGKPLTNRHGAPLRLIDRFKYGYHKSAKLVTRQLNSIARGEEAWPATLGPYCCQPQLATSCRGYDHPLNLGRKVRKKDNRVGIAGNGRRY